MILLIILEKTTKHRLFFLFTYFNILHKMCYDLVRNYA